MVVLVVPLLSVVGRDRRWQHLRDTVAHGGQSNQDCTDHFFSRGPRFLGHLDVKRNSAFELKSCKHSQVRHRRGFLVQRARTRKALNDRSPCLRVLWCFVHKGLKYIAYQGFLITDILSLSFTRPLYAYSFWGSCVPFKPWQD